MEKYSGHAPVPGSVRYISGPPFHQVTPTHTCIWIPITNFHMNKKNSNKTLYSNTIGCFVPSFEYNENKYHETEWLDKVLTEPDIRNKS